MTLHLTDTPSEYTGASGQVAVVTKDEDAIEFIDGLAMNRDEINTGVQWVDGKDIYRKVVVSGGSMVTISNGVNSMNHGIANLDRVLSLNGTLNRDSANVQRPPLNYPQPGAEVWALVTDIDVQIALNDVWTGAGNTLSDPIAIIEYTKTS